MKNFILLLFFIPYLLNAQDKNENLDVLEFFSNKKNIFEETKSDYFYLKTLSSYKLSDEIKIPSVNPQIFMNYNCTFKESDINSVEVILNKPLYQIIINLKEKKCIYSIVKYDEAPSQESRDGFVMNFSNINNDEDELNLIKSAKILFGDKIKITTREK
jgi:hypothetical protein